jgi:ABC-type multidrug transport system fused ATPase/permease subunit
MNLGSLKAMFSRRTLPLAILAVVPVLFAACNQVGGATLTFWDLVWGMVFFFFWIMWIMIVINIFVDIFRRNDLSGLWKVIWVIVIFWIPFIGILIYIFSRPKMTAQDLEMATQAAAAQKAASQVSVADQLEKLTQLRDAGTISVPEYEQLKAKLLAQ